MRHATHLHGAILALAIVSLPAASAHAQEAEPEVCLPASAHRLVLADLYELKGTPEKPGGVRLRVKLLEQKLSLQDGLMADLKLSRDLAIEAKESAAGANTAFARRAREAEEDRDAWYRSPLLLGGVGAAIAVAVVILANSSK